MMLLEKRWRRNHLGYANHVPSPTPFINNNLGYDRFPKRPPVSTPIDLPRGHLLSQGLLVSRPPLKRCQYMRISEILPPSVSQKMAPRASTHSPVRFRR